MLTIKQNFKKNLTNAFKLSLRPLGTCVYKKNLTPQRIFKSVMTTTLHATFAD